MRPAVSGSPSPPRPKPHAAHFPTSVRSHALMVPLAVPLWGSSSRQWQRWGAGTSPSTCSMWAPQPAYVGRPHLGQSIRRHIRHLVSGFLVGAGGVQKGSSAVAKEAFEGGLDRGLDRGGHLGSAGRRAAHRQRAFERVAVAPATMAGFQVDLHLGADVRADLVFEMLGEESGRRDRCRVPLPADPEAEPTPHAGSGAPGASGS